MGKQMKNILMSIFLILSLVFPLLPGASDKAYADDVVDAAAPVIVTQPKDMYAQGRPSYSFTLEVGASGEGILSYQWYQNDVNSNSGGTLLDGKTGYRLIIQLSSDSVGTVSYYYCVVTNTDSSATGEQTAETVSRAAEVVFTSYINAPSKISESAGLATIYANYNVRGRTLVLRYTFGSGTATVYEDFAVTRTRQGTVAANGYIYMDIVDDAVYEGDETMLLIVQTVEAGYPIETYSFTIVDNDAPTLSFDSDSYSVSEDGTSADITVTRSGDSNIPVAVDYATSGGTATAGSDYTAASGTLAFAAGVTSQSFTVPILDDSIYEGDETVSLVLSNATGLGATLGRSAATLTITDNDPAPPAIGAQPANVTRNIGETAAFTISATASDGGTLSYQWQKFTDGSGTWNDIEGATDASYTTPVLVYADSGAQYRCVVTNTKNAAAATTTSDTATLTVNPAYITVAGVTSMAVPAAGAAPQAFGDLTTADASYTVTGFTWQNSDGLPATLTAGGKFKAESTYQAVIELTAAAGYRFQAEGFTPTVNAGTAEAGVVSGGDVSGNKLTFTVAFAATEAQSVTGIAVKTQPAKLIYTAGESLDLAGLVVTITYNDGSAADIAYAQFGVNSIAASPANGTVMSLAAHNDDPVTVTHTVSGETAQTSSLTVNSSVLTGTATITGSAVFGQTLTASLNGGNNTGTLSYQWTRNGVDITGATSDTYTLTAADITAVIQVKITSSVETGTLTSDPTAAVEKADCETATGVTPVLSSKTTANITVTAVAGYEYILVADGAAIGTGAWRDSNGFTGLTANTPYDIYQRVKETATHKSSAVSEKLDVTTDAAPSYAASVSPTSKTFTAATAGYGQQTAQEFAIKNTGTGTITSLSAELGGTDFEISIPLSAATLNAGGTATVSVRPKTGLAVNTYTDTLTITGSNGISLTVNLSFTVTETQSVTSIAVKTQPAKLTYTAGEILDLAGLEATLTYSDGSTADIAYARFGANGVTADPDQGTVMETAIHNGQAIILTCNTHTATTGNLTVNAAPTYAITLSETGAYTFTARTAGYTPVAPITVTVTRLGTGDITNLAAALSGTDSGIFTLGALDAATLDSTTTSATFTIKPDDALAPGTYTATVTVTADNGISQGFNISFTVNALSAPTIQSAAAGDTHVNITWSSVPGATGYKIYQSAVSGSYGAELATVGDSVYSYDVANLINGTTYYFAVKAANPGGDSGYSNEVSATPRTVPGAPTNVAAVAGNGQATVSFTPPADNGGSAITGYTVTSNPGNITAAGANTTITVTGLSNGTTYTFTVAAANTAGTGAASAASTPVTPSGPSNGDSGESSTPSTPASPTEPVNTGIDILINGKTETAATATTIQQGDKIVTTVVVDDKKVEERLEQEGNNAVVTIPVSTGADVVVGTLNGQTVKNMETKEAVLEIKTGQVAYTLPASQINIDAISEQLGEQVELKDIAVSVKISEPAADTVKIIEDTANKNNYQIIVKPIEFEITCSSGNKTVEVDKFNVYVERMIAIPEGIDPSRITTGIILNSDGTFSHVPTVITVIDGKYYAKINSLTNSTYFVIYHTVEFKDVAGHWAKEAVNDMGSRLIVSGVGNGRFEPVRDITRAEFAAILAKALGLMRPGTGKASFNDISKDDWCYDAVSIAYEYGIVYGYGDGKFGTGDKITREQAMTMIAKAMQITKLVIDLTDSEASKVLAGFTDANSAAAYAKTGIAACVKAGIVSGRSKNDLAPEDNITRAEAAVIVRKLLQKSGLI